MIAVGDTVERGLTSIGITKDRVKKLTGKYCGCKKRQDKLNAWGHRVQRRVLAPYHQLLFRLDAARHWLRHSRFGYAYWHFREGIRVLLTGSN